MDLFPAHLDSKSEKNSKILPFFGFPILGPILGPLWALFSAVFPSFFGVDARAISARDQGVPQLIVGGAEAALADTWAA